MTKYVIAMKSGYSFVVNIKDMDDFIREIQSFVEPKATNNFYSSGGVFFNINDVSAIYPLHVQHSTPQEKEE